QCSNLAELQAHAPINYIRYLKILNLDNFITDKGLDKFLNLYFYNYFMKSKKIAYEEDEEFEEEIDEDTLDEDFEDEDVENVRDED
ncbi:MAG: hypothetical protein WC533_03605, partial [Candidatus Pacearchaeota archaeon]